MTDNDAKTKMTLPFDLKDYHRKALLKLLCCHHCNKQTLTYEELSREIGTSEKNKAWQCVAWKQLKENEFIIPSSKTTGKKQYMLSEKGVELATSIASPEELADYKMPETDEEHHEKIKSIIMKQEKAKSYGPKILDLLVETKDSGKLMTKHELAAKFNTVADAKGFFYGFQALMKMNIILYDGSKKRKSADEDCDVDEATKKKKKFRSGGKLVKLTEAAFLATTRRTGDGEA